MVKDVLLNKFTLVMAGGAVGSLLRYLVQGWGQALTKGTFPVGTLAVNVMGCFVIGVLNMVFAERIPIRMEYRVGLTVGVLGGFTTFSSFGWETFSMANEGQGLRAMMNMLLSITLGFLAVLAGYRIAERWVGV
ncbi:MAG TPA: fluoride efflux transporter CrcB [Phycisphaerae bacterium]|jgi:CrcB protein